MSNNAIENLTWKMCEEISKASNYIPVSVTLAGGKTVPFPVEGDSLDRSSLITAIILRDSNGSSYSIEPNKAGLDFAQGKMTYEEYLKSIRKNNRKYVMLFLGLTGTFFTVCSFVIKMLI